MGRVFVTLAGLALAIPSAMAVLGTTLVVAELQGGRLFTAPGFLDMVVAIVWSENPEALVRTTGRFLAATTCVPVIVAAVIGATAGLRSRPGYAALTAGLSVAVPAAAAGGGLSAAVVAPMVLVPLLLTGAAAGLVYATVAAPRNAEPGPHGSRPSIAPGDP